VGGSGGSGVPEVFDVAHPSFEDPSPPTQDETQRPLELKPSLQRSAAQALLGGGQAQNARLERGPLNRWPEVARILQLDMQLRGSNDYPRTENDGRVRRILERYSEGYTPDELADVVQRARADEHWGGIALHGVLKDPANFESMGKPRPRRGADDTIPGQPITLTAAEASKWR